MNPLEIMRANRGYVAALLVSIHERMSAAGEPTDETRSQHTADEAAFTAGSEYMSSTVADLAALELRDAQITELRVLAAIPTALQPGDQRESRDAGFNVTRTATSDPYDTTEARGAEMNGETTRARTLYNDAAREAVERSRPSTGDAGKESAIALIEGPDNARGQVGKHILRFGGPAYEQAFSDWVRDPMAPAPKILHERAAEMRAAMAEGSNSTGGFLLPFVLDPTIILTNAGTVGPWREISGKRTTTTNTWHGIASAGVTAEWIAEATEVADASPTVTQPTINVLKADAYIQASMEQVADSTISGEITKLMADAKGRLENAAFATGNGVTQPFGIVNATSGAGNSVAGSSGAAGAADLVGADIFALDNAMSPRYRPGASFVMNKAIANRVRQLASAGAVTPLNQFFWTDFGGANPSKLIGYNVYESSDMDGTIVSGSTDDVIVLGDFSQYLIVDRLGMELQYNPMVLGSNRRPTGEVAFVAFWRTGANTFNSGAFKTLRL